MPSKYKLYASPGRIILVSLIITIVTGTILLLSPSCRTQHLHWVDVFFTATSATCVTGLSTVPMNAFTNTGKLIILFLIQIGGLGLVTMTICFLAIFKQLGFTTQLLVGKVLELESWQNIRQLLFFIIKFTIGIEIVGTILIFFLLDANMPPIRRLFFSSFHAISSFCDAGFTPWPDSLIMYQSNHLFLMTTIFLMLSGGLGFTTWTELIQYTKNHYYKRKKFLSLYTKIVLYTTTALTIAATGAYWLLERNHAFAHMNPATAFLNAFFNAISSRSAGFITVPVSALHMATLFIVILISFIGSSPGSTGSGIKTTTFAVILATIHAAISGRTSVEIKGRRIPKDQVFKSLAVLSLSMAWIIIVILCLLITESRFNFFDIVFEVFSAFATLGISTGITASLTIFGKLLIALTMIVGRIGSLTLLLAIMRKRKESHEYEYPEERIMLG